MKPVSGLETELALFAGAVLTGVGMLILYDMLRVFRRIFSHGILWVSVEDFLYGILVSGFFFLELCRENSGVIRGYILLGLALGAVLYHRLLSRHLMKHLTKWIYKAKNRLKNLCKKVTMKKIDRKPRETEEKE